MDIYKKTKEHKALFFKVFEPKTVWLKPQYQDIPTNRPLLVKTYDGKYCVMYYHPKFRDGTQIGARAQRAWVSISPEDLLYGPKDFSWMIWRSVVAYYEFPLEM